MINISISHRAIKIGAIFIAILILICMTIPAVSDVQPNTFGPKKLGPKKFGVYDTKIFQSPNLKILYENEAYLGYGAVVNMGFDNIEGNNYVWALIYLNPPSGAENQVKYYQMVYIPAPRLQSLCEVSLGTGAEMEVYGHLIAKPEELNLQDQVLLYEVTRVRVLPGY